MSRILQTSRLLFLGVAFVCVLSGAGGLMGAIGGLVLALLGHAVLGVAEGVIVLLPTGAGLGAGAAMLLGMVLMARQISMPVLRLRWATASRSDS